MSRRNKGGGGAAAAPSAPLWLASFSDMMTNVLCFFILIVSFALQKRGLLMEDGLGSIRQKLKPVAGAEGTLQGSVTPVQFHAGRVVNRAASPINQKALVEKSGRVLDANRDTLKAVVVDAMQKSGRSVVPLPLVFDEGSSELSAGHRAFLDEFARQVGNGTFQILVEGFAYEDAKDDADGWLVAEARARNVADHLADRGVDPKRLRTQGRGMLRNGPFTRADGPDIPQNRYGRRIALMTLMN
jgi:chemotaxis protein MotB